MTDDLERRLDRLREEWPVGSMADDVMSRIGAEAPRRGGRRVRWLAGATASAAGLLGAMAIAWLFIAARPATLLAAVQRGLEESDAAHLVFTNWDEGGRKHRGDLWYIKGRGLRLEEPGRVLVEEGRYQSTWRTDGAEPVVIRRRSPGFFAAQLPQMLALQASPDGWRRERSPELDRDVDGRACRGFTFAAPPEQFPGRPAPRARMLVDAEDRVRRIGIEERRGDGSWRLAREVSIEYDPALPPERLAFAPPAGARLVDRDDAFRSLYPLERALFRFERGGLILAVHDVRPLANREGIYVVSSVRGTPAFLAEHPPRRRPINPERVEVDVAFQQVANAMYSGRYDTIGLAEATQDGVQYAWRLVVPRRFFRVVDGRREYLPEPDPTPVGPDGEPGRLDEPPGKAHVPLAATYWDPALRGKNGPGWDASTWAEVAIPADRPPATVEDAAARARRDLLLLGGGDAGYTLLGVAAGAKVDGPSRPMSRLIPEAVSDAEYAAAVRRGLDDVRGWDELRGEAFMGERAGGPPPAP